MASFSEVSKALEAALLDATSKKKALENADKVLKEAGDAYQAAVYKAQDLRGQLNALLNEALPADQIKPKIG
jgi:hypothetical protein